MIQTGKNQPCPCGSGKKYKCCRMTEKEKRPASAAWQMPRNSHELKFSFSPEAVNTGDQDIDSWWAEFTPHDQRHDGAAMRGCVNAFLDQHPGKAEELGLEESALFDIHEAVADDDIRFSGFVALLERLRRDFPAVCCEDSAYINLTLIEDALVRGETGRLPSLLEAFRPSAEVDLKYYNELVKLLTLHDDNDILDILLRRTAFKVAELNEQAFPGFASGLLLGADILEFIVVGDTSPAAVSRFGTILEEGECAIPLDELVAHAKEPARLTISATLGHLRRKDVELGLIGVMCHLLKDRGYSRFQAAFVGNMLTMFLFSGKRKKLLAPSGKDFEAYKQSALNCFDAYAYLDCYALLKGLRDFQDHLDTPLDCQALFEKLRGDGEKGVPGRRLFRNLA